MIHAIVLAGGVGSRFWPLSRTDEPKQFLKLGSGECMLVEALKQIKRFVPSRNILVATNVLHRGIAVTQAKRLGIPTGNVFGEPQARNTLAPIAVLSQQIYQRDSQAVVVVVPADHFVKDRRKFVLALRQACDVAQKGYLVTLGARPTRPETGYGYIKISPRSIVKSPRLFYCNVKFIEKPAFARAKMFLKDKRYFWNSGIFVFMPQVLLGELRRYFPRAYATIGRMTSKARCSLLWRKLPATSIDYGIMERTNLAAMTPVSYGWIDLGSWQAIEEISGKDKQGNIFKGSHVDIGSRDSLVWAGKRLVATVGLRNVIVVDTHDALLVCAKDRTQDVKKVVNLIKQRKLT